MNCNTVCPFVGLPTWSQIARHDLCERVYVRCLSPKSRKRVELSLSPRQLANSCAAIKIKIKIRNTYSYSWKKKKHNQMQTYAAAAAAAAHKKPKTLKVIFTFTYWNSCARFSTIGRRFQMLSFQMKRPPPRSSIHIHPRSTSLRIQMRKMMKLPIKAST